MQRKAWQEEKEGEDTTVNSGGGDRNENGGDASMEEGIVSIRDGK